MIKVVGMADSRALGLFSGARPWPGRIHFLTDFVHNCEKIIDALHPVEVQSLHNLSKNWIGQQVKDIGSIL
jgi:hypothetical protein